MSGIVLNKKGSTELGDALTKVPAMVLVFVIMLIFIIFAGIIAKNHQDSFNLAEDFYQKYLIYDGKVMTVKDLFHDFCTLTIFGKDDIRENVSVALNDAFTKNYGYNNYFAVTWKPLLETRIFSSNLDLSQLDVDNEGDLSITSDKGDTKFYNLFDIKNKDSNVKIICGDYRIYTRVGGEL